MLFRHITNPLSLVIVAQAFRNTLFRVYGSNLTEEVGVPSDGGFSVTQKAPLLLKSEYGVNSSDGQPQCRNPCTVQDSCRDCC